jgi:hemolysin activation/secretion protein
MTKTKKHSRLLMALALISSTSLAPAQTVPDAGSLLQQIERNRPLQPKRPVQPDVATPPQELKAAPGISVTVARFVFEGNTLLAPDQLGAAVASYLNRPLDFADLQKAAAAVAERYRQAGWVVRAYLPKQDIDGGTVTIQIVEGRFGRAQLEGDAPLHLKISTALGYIQAVQKPGEPVNADAIDRAAMLLDDLPGLAASYAFREGQIEGETDLVLKLSDTPVFLGNVDADNTGARSTGAQRLSVTAYLESALGLGEQAMLNLIKTEGSNYARAGLTLPWGYTGLRVGVSASHMDYNLVAPEFALLDVHGTASTTGLEASYPLVRSRSSNLSLQGNLDRKQYDNATNLGSTSHYLVDVATVALNANNFDALWGGGANSASLALTSGTVDLAGSANQAADAASTQTEGRFAKAKLTLGRNQTVTDDVSLYGQLAVQRANRNLDSSEKLNLGGASGVRAYPGAEGSGADGQTLSLEARWRLPSGLNFSVFYDWGQITAVNHVNTAPSGAELTPLNAYSLHGYGVSVSWAAPFGAQVKGTWARRLGSNPNPTAAGLDQDGSLDLDRFWLTASVPF